MDRKLHFQLENEGNSELFFEKSDHISWQFEVRNECRREAFGILNKICSTHRLFHIGISLSRICLIRTSETDPEQPEWFTTTLGVVFGSRGCVSIPQKHSQSSNMHQQHQTQKTNAIFGENRRKAVRSRYTGFRRKPPFRRGLEPQDCSPVLCGSFALQFAKISGRLDPFS